MELLKVFINTILYQGTRYMNNVLYSKINKVYTELFPPETVSLSF